MSVLTAVLIGLATGVVFGFALEKSRVFEPGVIVGQMQLRNFLMLKIFLAAVITGLIVLAVLNGVFGVEALPEAAAVPGRHHRRPDPRRRHRARRRLPGHVAGADRRRLSRRVVRRPRRHRRRHGVRLFQRADRQRFFPTRATSSHSIACSACRSGWWRSGLAAVLTVGLVVLERMTSWRDEVGADVDGLGPKVADAGAAETHRTVLPRGA